MIRHAVMITLSTFIAIAALGQDIDGQAQGVLENTIEEHDLVGLSAAILVDGDVIWSGGAGFADIENQVPATADMVHRIASISKPITATAVMQLVEQGKVNLDDVIQDHISDYPEARWPIQVHHLLNHTSGIRHYKPGESGTMEHYPTIQDALPVFWEDRTAFEPGRRYKYTTFGYAVLGRIIEVASGQTFGEYMEAHVWTPAGMENTRLEWKHEIIPNRARGYNRDEDTGEIINERYTDISIKFPGGGMISTAPDLVRFAHAFYTHKLVKPETYERMLEVTPVEVGQETTYGLGWSVHDTEARGLTILHSGGQAGTATLLRAYPDHDVAVAVISNVYASSPHVYEAMNGLCDLVLPPAPDTEEEAEGDE